MRLLHCCSPLLALGLLCPAAVSAATRSYIVSDFDTIRLEAPIAVAIQSRPGVTARGEGDADMLERIDLRQMGRTLVIRLKPSPFENRRPNAIATARLFLTVPTLHRIELAGSGALVADKFTALNGEIVAAGSGSLSVSGVASDRLSIAQLGSAQLRLAGKAGNATVRVSGSGALDASKLSIADLDLVAEGAGTAQLLATRKASIVAIGAGSVSVDGHPACTVRHVGSGAVSCGSEDY